jgi:hypothetical protein
MKTRLAEVQDKLQHLEQESQDQGDTEPETRRSNSQDRTRGQDGGSITPPTNTGSFMSKTQDMGLMEQRIYSSNLFAQNGEENEGSLAMQNMQLLSPVTTQSHSSEGETAKMYERLILNQLNVPKYVLDKLISEQENSFLQPSNASQNVSKWLATSSKL